MKPSWGLIVAMVLMLASVFGFVRAARPFLEQFKGKAFAMRQAEVAGLASWPLDSESDYGGRQRYLFRSPTDAKTFADLTIEFKNGQWKVAQLNKEFRPWKFVDAASP